MKLSDLTGILEKIAPTRFAEEWDNVGLLAGDPNAFISRVLLTIDYTAAVAREAEASKVNLVIAYHPPIFNPLERLTAPSLVFNAIRDGIALYSPHTALDVAGGGTNDMLADLLGLSDRRPLRLHPTQSTQYKLVTFVPGNEIESVSEAIFAAGAGQIGNYSSCGFRTAGEGTFFGNTQTNPAVGRRGRLERTPEIRLETIVPMSRIPQVIAALRKSHPYEEPAFDLNELAAPPEGRGMGRIGSLPSLPRSKVFAKIKKGLRVKHLLIAGPTTGNIKKAAVCAGSCGSLLNDALSAGADLFLTGEVRHHDAIKAASAGMTIVCALHSNSERPVLARLKSRLAADAPGLKVTISRADRDPFSIH